MHERVICKTKLLFVIKLDKHKFQTTLKNIFSISLICINNSYTIRCIRHKMLNKSTSKMSKSQKQIY